MRRWDRALCALMVIGIGAPGCATQKAADRKAEAMPSAPTAREAAADEEMADAPEPAREQGAKRRMSRGFSRQPDVHASCPKAFTEVTPQQCASLPRGYGEQPGMPAEWGIGAGTGKLWFGRLMCPDGAMPLQLRRVGNIGGASTPSQSPPSSSARRPLDIVDKWEVTCPQRAPIIVYHNMYRCGSPCPPATLKLLPAKAFSSLAGSLSAYQRGDLAEADTIATQGLSHAPNYELMLIWASQVKARQDRHAEALKLLERADAIHPNSPSIQLNMVESLVALDRHADALRQIQAVEKTLPAQDPKTPRLQCLKASALLPTEPAQARKLAASACAAGEKRCC